MSGSPRVAMLMPYWTFWESAAGGPGFRREREALLEEAARGLAAADGGLEIVWRGMVDSTEAGERAAGEISEAGADTILVAQTMAVPPMYAKTALDGLADLPVVVWAAQRSRSVWVGFDQYDITAQGATVGTPMLTNVLSREGRPFELATGAVADRAFYPRLARIIAAAAAARSVSRARIARVGRPMDGYACVDVDDEALRRAAGIEAVAVSPEEVADRYRECRDVSRLEAEIEERFALEPGAEEGDLARVRSLRLAAALEELDREGGFDAGAMNCHVPQIRYGEDPGVTPCYALGRETTRGIPWTCTGDMVTAVAMLVAKRLAGAALYHEVEAIDFVRGETAIANSGEHDLAWCPEDVRPRLGPNPWFLSDPLTGVRAWFELPPGPATLVGFTPHFAEPSGFRLIAAEGDITERSFPDSPTAGGAFRFAGDDPVGEMWSRWAEAGVNHHSACAPGRIADQVAIVARYLKIGFVQVS